ncbi:hypothetical protein LTR84_010657 [Exophiala bonariae]|uniref:MARVEL domain-containing protein n=1 Tax=Exophiala bonariae TaxID=1690606 RepID=A0AAV9MT34_9EURO|nr:hypothetical protein LTR84_010657 [Exophiala bonariae]
MFQYAQAHRPEFILPGWFVYLRIAQGVLAVLSLILSAFAAAKFVDTTADTATFFAWTAIYIPAAIFVIPQFPDEIKSIAMFLIMDVLSTIWWLVGFGLSTAAAVLLGAALDIVINAFGSDPRTKVYDDYLRAWTIGCAVTRASVGVAGLEL